MSVCRTTPWTHQWNLRRAELPRQRQRLPTGATPGSSCSPASWSLDWASGSSRPSASSMWRYTSTLKPAPRGRPGSPPSQWLPFTLWVIKLSQNLYRNLGSVFFCHQGALSHLLKGGLDSDVAGKQKRLLWFSNVKGNTIIYNYSSFLNQMFFFNRAKTAVDLLPDIFQIFFIPDLSFGWLIMQKIIIHRYSSKQHF